MKLDQLYLAHLLQFPEDLGLREIEPKHLVNGSKKVCEKFLQLVDEERYDLGTLATESDISLKTLIALTKVKIDPSNAATIIKQLKDRYALKQIHKLSGDNWQTEAQKILEESQVFYGKTHHISQVVDEYLGDIEASKGKEILYVPTPWEGLTEKWGGMFGGKLCILGGRTGMGKTLFVRHFRETIIKHGHAIATFALEMSKKHNLERTAAANIGIPMKEILRKNFLKDEIKLKRMQQEMFRIRKLPWYLYGSEFTTYEKLVREIYRLKEENPKLFYVEVDFAQLLYSNYRSWTNRTYELGHISANLSKVAIETDTFIMLTAQINRNPEQRQDKRPFQSDIKDSDGLATSADIVATLYRESYYDPSSPSNITEVNTHKNRLNDDNGTGIIKLGYDNRVLTEVSDDDWNTYDDNPFV